MKFLVNVFKINELIEKQYDKYLKLEPKIQEYFKKQKKKYFTDEQKPEKITGGDEENVLLFDIHIEELHKLDVECLDQLILKRIIKINKIKTEEELINEAENLLKMSKQEDRLFQYKYRLILKTRITELSKEIQNSVVNMDISEITTIAPTDKKEIIPFLIKVLEKSLPKLQEMEKIYDSCAVMLAEIIQIWEEIIGPSTEPCIKHAEFVLYLHIGSILIGLIAKKKFNANDTYGKMKDLQDNVEKNILPLVELKPIYNNKFLWENIYDNINMIERYNIIY